jgi:hypothetical protein
MRGHFPTSLHLASHPRTKSLNDNSFNYPRVVTTTNPFKKGRKLSKLTVHNLGCPRMKLLGMAHYTPEVGSRLRRAHMTTTDRGPARYVLPETDGAIFHSTMS